MEKCSWKANQVSRSAWQPTKRAALIHFLLLLREEARLFSQFLFLFKSAVPTSLRERESGKRRKSEKGKLASLKRMEGRWKGKAQSSAQAHNLSRAEFSQKCFQANRLPTKPLTCETDSEFWGKVGLFMLTLGAPSRRKFALVFLQNQIRIKENSKTFPAPNLGLSLKISHFCHNQHPRTRQRTSFIQIQQIHSDRFEFKHSPIGIGTAEFF